MKLFFGARRLLEEVGEQDGCDRGTDQRRHSKFAEAPPCS